MSDGGGARGLTWRRILTVALPIAAAAFAINAAIRAFALGRFDVPAAALPLAGTFMGSVMPVLGPAFGCYMAFRDPGRDSMKNFLLVSAVLVFIGPAVQLVLFTTIHHHVRALTFGLIQGALATALALPALVAVARPAVPGVRRDVDRRSKT
jgi:hypothetical protein